MMRALVIGLLLASTSIASARTVPEIPVRFDMAAEGVRSVAAAKSLTGGTVHSASIVDVDGDGAGEVFARTDCVEGDVCRVRLFRSSRGQWAKVFDERVGAISLGAAGIDGTRALMTSGGVWSWNFDKYVYDVKAAGDQVAFVPLPADRSIPVATQFGAGARKLVEDGIASLEVAVVSPQAQGQSLLLARLTGQGVCGVKLGCPVRLLAVKDGAYSNLLTGMGSGAVVLAHLKREGWSDIVTERPDGSHGVYGWNSLNYVDIYGNGGAVQ
jgi:hypothetical protein